MRTNKWIVTLVLIIGVPFICFMVDKIFGRIHQSQMEVEQVQVEVGDLIFRTNSYILSSGKYYYKSGIPGHLAIAVSEGSFSSSDESLGNIDVVESALLNRNRGKFQAEVAFNKAYENFGNIRGRRFLLKMHLNSEQKQRLIELASMKIGRPYSIFALKNNPTKFNCATFARWVILQVDEFDLDADGGFIVFPNDILKNPRFNKPGDRLRF
ncbi:MAG: hypothetical protein JZU47_02400 [Prolixibacteraceae bacterium]|nr:hypothetical protein [Prolixibacteraceae bacterium]